MLNLSLNLFTLRLRESYSIYRLPIEPDYKNDLKITKAALKGKMMENYFRPKKGYFVLTCDQETNETTAKMSLCGCKCVCRKNVNTSITPKPKIQVADLCSTDKESLPNKHFHGILKCIEEQHKSVEIIKNLNNEDYDILLSENLVFLDLVEPSAVNTILECIVRNTPVFVNPHPAVVEILGQDYPGYYSSLKEASDKAIDFEIILKAHKYLQSMDKSFLTIQHFWNSLASSKIYKSLCEEF
jgi:hypothetical protein